MLIVYVPDLTFVVSQYAVTESFLEFIVEEVIFALPIILLLRFLIIISPLILSILVFQSLYNCISNLAIVPNLKLFTFL